MLKRLETYHSSLDWSSFKSLRSQYRKRILSSKSITTPTCLRPLTIPSASGRSQVPLAKCLQTNYIFTANPVHPHLPLFQASHLQIDLLLSSHIRRPYVVLLLPANLLHHLHAYLLRVQHLLFFFTPASESGICRIVSYCSNWQN